MLKCIIKIVRKTPNYYKNTSRFDVHIKIGATGFEPATSRPPAVRATKLRHTPQQRKLYQRG